MSRITSNGIIIGLAYMVVVLVAMAALGLLLKVERVASTVEGRVALEEFESSCKSRQFTVSISRRYDAIEVTAKCLRENK